MSIFDFFSNVAEPNLTYTWTKEAPNVHSYVNLTYKCPLPCINGSILHWIFDDKSR